ncbi:hypothetical protein AU374_05242 [Cupriavidus metallidurans]|nr:hypothetical protein AU374_05242 [Cupriavidus metallidurans]
MVSPAFTGIALGENRMVSFIVTSTVRVALALSPGCPATDAAGLRVAELSLLGAAVASNGTKATAMRESASVFMANLGGGMLGLG